MSKQIKFIVIDWANNRLYGEKTWPSFEDAWEQVQIDNPDEEDLGDYYVIPLSEYQPNGLY